MEQNVNSTVENNGAQEQAQVQEAPQQEVKTFTQEEVDKIVAKRLAREKKDIEAKIEAERKEAEELAKLSEAEKQKKLFEKQVREFEETKKAFEAERLLNETTKQLASKNLPVEFANMLKAADAESTFENIKLFEAKFNEALERMVSDRLKGNPPRTGVAKAQQYTAEDIKGMTPEEINRNWEQIKNIKL
jgi:hypothetical protein